MQNKTSENIITHVGVTSWAIVSMKKDTSNQHECVFHGTSKHTVASGCKIVLSGISTNKRHCTRRLRPT